jgi:gluconate 2-dehydrogenase alpha chain
MSVTKLKPVEAVVVGSGMSGSIVAMELASAGLQVLTLERGRMADPQHDFAMPHVHDELKYERHSDIFQDLSRETITFRNHTGQTALPMREMGSFKPGEIVGGTAAHWGCHARRFLPDDFTMKSKIESRYGKKFIPGDMNAQDWGVTYDEFEPYYDQYEQIYGVAGKAGNLNGERQKGGNPFEGARSREFPNPQTPRTPQGEMFAKAVQSLGYTPFQNPAAAMTQPYLNLYKQHLGECARGGFCSSTPCSQGAKASPLTTVIPALMKQPKHELRTLCNVIKVNLDSDGKRAVGVTYVDARGRMFEQPADIVVLATYCFNNTRLLLLSGIGKPYDPASNTGVVGRNYSYQTGGKVAVFFDDIEFNPFIGGGMIGTCIDDFNADNFDHANLGFIGGGYLAVQNSGFPPIKGKLLPPGTPRWGAGWKEAAAKYYRRAFQIGWHASCMSYRGHYLDLDPTYRDSNGLPLLRMTFDWHQNEQKMSAFLRDKCVEIAKAMNPSKIGTNPIPAKYSIVPYQSTHNIGGAVMGANPSTSVVNKYLQSWDVHNVFVVGGSAFPQNAGNPPTETIGMLACWTADAIKDYAKKPGALA